jgi:hypothetical protein
MAIIRTGKKLSKKDMRRAAAEIFGEDSRGLLQILKEIASGEAEIIEPGKYGEAVSVRPSFSERLTAIQTVLSYQHGKPHQSTTVETVERPTKWNPDLLSVEEINQIESLVKKATPLPPNTIEGEYAETNEEEEE